MTTASRVFVPFTPTLCLAATVAASFGLGQTPGGGHAHKLFTGVCGRVFERSRKPQCLLKASKVSSNRRVSALLVEANRPERLETIRSLEALGLDVYCSETNDDALRSIHQNHFSVVLIEFGASGQASSDLCAAIRSDYLVPIIALIAVVSTLDERAVLAAGADDYVLKPIVSRLLSARVSNQLRRSEGFAMPEQVILSWGALSVDAVRHSFTVSGSEVSLTVTEFKLIQLLLSEPHRVFTRGQILDAVDAFDGLNSDHLIDSHVSRLRRKIREAQGPDVVTAVRGIGFRLTTS